MNTSRGSTRSRSRGSEPPRLPRLRSRELSSRSRGSSPQRESSSTGHLRKKRQGFYVHAAAQQSCRANVLRARDLNPREPRRQVVCHERGIGEKRGLQEQRTREQLGNNSA